MVHPDRPRGHSTRDAAARDLARRQADHRPDVLERHLRFRGRLRADRDLADQYARLKRDLAERYRDDRGAYSAAKAEFVRRVAGAVTGQREA